MPPKAETAEAEAPEEKQGEAAVEDMTRAEKDAWEDGVALAEKYKAEAEARPDDHELVVAEKNLAAAEAAREEEAEAAESEQEAEAKSDD